MKNNFRPRPCHGLFHRLEIQDFADGVKQLLSPEGVFIIEFAHLLEMFDKRFFDVIYHEHLSFFALAPLIPFFEKRGLKIFDVRKVLTQGGSLRVYVSRAQSKKHKTSAHVAKIVREEHAAGLDSEEAFREFAAYVQDYRASLRRLLQKLKRGKKKIVGVGAPAKGVILLNYCRIDNTLMDYLVDSTPLKQHRFMPGVHIPVFPEERLAEDTVDYFLLLAHNFQDAILKKLSPYLERGAKVILPFPQGHVL